MPNLEAVANMISIICNVTLSRHVWTTHGLDGTCSKSAQNSLGELSHAIIALKKAIGRPLPHLLKIGILIEQDYSCYKPNNSVKKVKASTHSRHSPSLKIKTWCCDQACRLILHIRAPVDLTKHLLLY